MGSKNSKICGSLTELYEVPSTLNWKQLQNVIKDLKILLEKCLEYFVTEKGLFDHVRDFFTKIDKAYVKAYEFDTCSASHSRSGSAFF